MSTIAIKGARSYTRGFAVVIGIIVVFAFVMLMVSAAPSKQMLEVNGAHNTNPVSGLSSIYSSDNMKCAFQSMNCNIVH